MKTFQMRMVAKIQILIQTNLTETVRIYFNPKSEKDYEDQQQQLTIFL